jgi:precorrin-6B C5,15-methyltransferase / cobalt-precorrin-6B C5,C15-methyltransferase
VTAWLHIIGVGEAGVDALPQASRLIIGYAETILGPERFLRQVEQVLTGATPPELDQTGDSVAKRNFEAIARALLDDEGQPSRAIGQPSQPEPDMPELIEWEGGLAGMIAQVERLRDTPTVILASGDPMWFGIGATLSKHLDPGEFEAHPCPSAFQLAAAALRWPLQGVNCISLHGRPAELIVPYVVPGSRILALTSDADTARQVADILSARGYAESMLTVLESLGGPEERTTSSIAVDFDSSIIGDFYILAVDCAPGTDAQLLPPLPGLPDDAFAHDGQLTKREIRAVTLSKLVPLPGALLWDVGAGSGAIAIEWMRAAREAEAIAFERDEERLQLIAVNALALGVPQLRIESGEAPQSLSGMASPDAVFLGGSVGDDGLFNVCWNALKPGGRLVANAVTIDGEVALYARQEQHGGELVRIETAVLDTIGEHRVLKPRMAVLQWSVTKPQQWLARRR